MTDNGTSLSAEALYLDPGHLKDYQVQDIARLRELGRGVLGWDTGMGKSRGLLALACQLLDEASIDTVLLVCEQNKLTEWEADIASLTAATWRRHHGPGRHRSLHQPTPHFLITTYETAREDAVSGLGDSLTDGPLTTALRGRQVLVAYDEMPKLAEFSSGLYQAHSHLLARLNPFVVGLTATPYTRDWDSVFAMFRLVCPDVLPDREQFEQLCVASRKPRGKTIFVERHIRSHLLTPIRPYLLRRRKTDPQVAHLFPRMRELPVHTTMTPDQAMLYRVMEQLGDESGTEVPGLWNVLRMIASYPEALLSASVNSKLVEDMLATFSEGELKAMRPGKLDALLRLAGDAIFEGRKVVIFSFFGPSMLPLLARDLEPLGVPVMLHYGERGPKACREALGEFRGHDGPAILLSSDSGSRGINLPQASRLVEYECALTYLGGSQRRNRIHRLDSPYEEVACATLIADDTLEQPIAEKMLQRNRDTDELLGDQWAVGSFVSAEHRRALMKPWGSHREPQPIG